jgi:hypothetical protein
LPNLLKKCFGAIFHRGTAFLYFATPRFTMLFSERANGPKSMQADHLWWLGVLVSFRDQTQPDWVPAVSRSSVQDEVALTKISASRFASVLQAIGPPNGRRLEILRAHYAAPGRAATATVLAEVVGFKGSIGINLSYGTLAKQIGLLIGEDCPNISLLFEVVRPTTATSRECVLVMRPEFADGLKRAGWIED